MQSYGRAGDLCKANDQYIITSEKVVTAIVAADYVRDPLAVLSDVYHDFVTWLTTLRGSSEYFRNYGSCFQAKVSKLNAHGSKVILAVAVTVFVLLANADVDATQRICILPNSAPKSGYFAADATTDDYLDAVLYATIASVLRQCERNPVSLSHPSSISAAIERTSRASGL